MVEPEPESTLTKRSEEVSGAVYKDFEGREEAR